MYIYYNFNDRQVYKDFIREQNLIVLNSMFIYSTDYP